MVFKASFQAPKGVSEYVPPRGALFEQARRADSANASRASSKSALRGGTYSETPFGAWKLMVVTGLSGPAPGR